jgi:NRPS condensation-like uncharacterized protein
MEIDLQDNVAYRVFIIPEYKENESIVFWVLNHSMADGIGFWSALTELS